MYLTAQKVAWGQTLSLVKIPTSCNQTPTLAPDCSLLPMQPLEPSLQDSNILGVGTPWAALGFCWGWGCCYLRVGTAPRMKEAGKETRSQVGWVQGEGNRSPGKQETGPCWALQALDCSGYLQHHLWIIETGAVIGNSGWPSSRVRVWHKFASGARQTCP